MVIAMEARSFFSAKLVHKMLTSIEQSPESLKKPGGSHVNSILATSPLGGSGPEATP